MGQLESVPRDDHQLAFSLLEKIGPIFSSLEENVYLVGGAVRDLFLDRPIHDLDFAVPRKALTLTFRLADKLGYPAYVLDRERDAGRVMLPDLGATIDIAAFRGQSLEEDLQLRDFTINSMAIPALDYQGMGVIDPFNGIQDIERKIIKLTRGDAIATDPVRALRAVRLAAELSFSLSRETTESILAYGSLLVDVSQERIRDELLKILESSNSTRGLALLYDLRLLEVIIPGSRSSDGHLDGLDIGIVERIIATFRVLENMALSISSQPESASDKYSPYLPAIEEFSQDLVTHFSRNIDGGISGYSLLKLGALLAGLVPHGGEESTSLKGNEGFDSRSDSSELFLSQFGALKLSREATIHLRKMILGRRALLSLACGKSFTRREIYSFFQDNEPAGIDIAWLTLASATAGEIHLANPTRYADLLSAARELFHGYFRLYDEVVRPVLLVNGADIMSITGLKQGPEIGKLLSLVEENQAAGEVVSRDQALELVRQRTGSAEPNRPT